MGPPVEPVISAEKPPASADVVIVGGGVWSMWLLRGMSLELLQLRSSIATAFRYERFIDGTRPRPTTGV